MRGLETRGNFENCIQPFKKYQKWVQMIPGTIFDIFQPMNDFFYGLDVEIRPKLTPGAGTPRWSLAAIHPRWGNRYVLPMFNVGCQGTCVAQMGFRYS